MAFLLAERPPLVFFTLTVWIWKWSNFQSSIIFETFFYLSLENYSMSISQENESKVFKAFPRFEGGGYGLYNQDKTEIIC